MLNKPVFNTLARRLTVATAFVLAASAALIAILLTSNGSNAYASKQQQRVAMQHVLFSPDQQRSLATLLTRSEHLTINPRYLRDFNVIRMAARNLSHRSTALTPLLRDKLLLTSSSNGVNVLAVQAVSTAAGPISVLAGPSSVCLLHDNETAETCSEPGSVSPESGGLRTTTGAPDGSYQIVSGLVPDGNSAVSIALADGATLVAPVTDNVYSIAIAGQKPISVTDKDATGVSHTWNVF